MRALPIALVLFVASVTSAAAQLSNLPKLTQPVNDIACVIDADSARELDTRIRALRDATGNVVVIVTVPTIAPYATVDEYAVKLFEKAGIGERKLDNGVLILVAVKEHGIRVEVGYGLEATITDGFAGDTIRTFMVPEFRANRYGPGLLAGTTHLIDRINAPASKETAGATATSSSARKSMMLVAILLFAIGAGVVGLIVFVIYRIAKRNGGVRTTAAAAGMLAGSSSDDEDKGSSGSSSSSSDSSSSSSFDGFSGGSSGGGGASGSW